MATFSETRKVDQGPAQFQTSAIGGGIARGYHQYKPLYATLQSGCKCVPLQYALRLRSYASVLTATTVKLK